MEDGEDWIMRPVLAQMCKMESLLDGTISLHLIMIMNEALDVQAENQYRLQKKE